MAGESESTNRRWSNRGAAEICSENFREARRRKFFRVVATHAYPVKTVAGVHALTGEAERTIYEWMAGRTEPPAGVMLQLFGEITRRG
jgi:hypothetical protein